MSLPLELVVATYTQAGLPAPVPEFRFHPTRRWRLDYAWPDRYAALEVEGGIWTQGRHTRPRGFLKDLEKYNAATALGWSIIRCTPQTVLAQDTISWLLMATLDVVVTDHGGGDDKSWAKRHGGPWRQICRRFPI